MKTIYVIIPVMNLWEKFTEPLIKSLSSIEIPDGCSLKTVVIDNVSVDATKEQMEKLSAENSGIEYVRNDANIGCGPAWNVGIRMALEKDADYILVVNNDIVIHPQAIKNIVHRMKKQDDVILATFSHRISLTEMLCESPTESENECPDFAGFMIDKRLFEEVGEFDEGFFPAYFEDNDMHRRILLAGKKAIQLNSAPFFHFGSKTQNQVSGGIVTSPMFEKNREYFIQKWGGRPGNETFTTPFNDPVKTIKSTKQKP